ncbi:uncharacterized protein METZ01_LOCUS354747, partial [marine metagenome]
VTSVRATARMAEHKSNASVKAASSSLTTIFIVLFILKATDTGKIGDWPWVYVCMPLIIQAGFIALLCCCAGAAFAASSSTSTKAECPI